MDKSFKGNNVQSIENLQKLEAQTIKTIINRVRIFESHIEYLKKNGINNNKIKTDVYNELKSLKELISEFKVNISQKREKLKKELSSVNRTTAKFSRASYDTATRIDIIT